MSPADWIHTLRDIGIPDPDLHNLAQCALEPSILAEAGTNQHVAAIAAATHRDSWFTIQGLSTVVSYSRGVVPGDPFGDVIFTFLMTRCLREISTALHSQDLLPNLASWSPAGASCFNITDSTHSGANVSYLDDAAFTLLAPDAERLFHYIRGTVTIVNDVFARYHMRLNFKAAKTELLCRLYGTGARTTWQAVHAMESPSILVATSTGDVHFRITRIYKHLGTLTCASGSYDAEVQFRCASAATTTK